MLCSLAAAGQFAEFNVPKEKKISQGFDPVLYHFRDDTLRNETFIYPLMIWSENNSFMPGIFISNLLKSNHRVDYQVFPMYSAEFESMIGLGKISFNQLLGKNNLPDHDVFVQAKSYFLPDFEGASLRYYQWESGLHFSLDKGSDSIPIKHKFGLKYHQNGTQTIEYVATGSEYTPERRYKMLRAIRAQYQFEKMKLDRPFRLDVNVDAWNNFGRLTALYEYDNFYAPKRSFNLRVYGGAYLFHDNDFVDNFDARLNPSAIGYTQDVFYDGCYIGRDPRYAFYNQQGLSGNGCMYSVSPLGKTWDWTMAASANISLPLDLPLRFYLAAGIIPDALNGNKPFAVVEGGILIMPLKKYIEIAFPLFVDTRSNDVLKLNTDNYLQRIRFIVNFDRIKFLKWPVIQTRK